MALVQQPQQSQLLAPVLGQSSPVQYAGLFQKHFMHYLLVLKQQSAAEERITKNGIQKTVHVVVKNSPFIVVVGQNPEVPLSFDLSRVAFDCALVYDTDDESTPKIVDFVRAKPMEFKPLPSDSGDQIPIELRIKVLTSQHEDMLFRVLIQGVDPATKVPIPNLRAWTGPIKVISKPEQIKKKAARPASTPDCFVTPPQIQRIKEQQASRKRTTSDLMTEAIARIEQQQQEHGKMLEQLIAMRLSDKDCLCPPKEKSGKELDIALSNLLHAYASIEAEKRPSRIRDFVHSVIVSQEDQESMSEMMDMFRAEGLKKELGHVTAPSEVPTFSCDLDDMCPDFPGTHYYC